MVIIYKGRKDDFFYSKFKTKKSKCTICKRTIEWRHENKRWSAYLLTGERDECFVSRTKKRLTK